MKLYYFSLWVGNYEIMAVADSPENCQKALVKEYNKQFGSFRQNGFKNAADWLEYHGADDINGIWEIELNKAIVK